MSDELSPEPGWRLPLVVKAAMIGVLLAVALVACGGSSAPATGGVIPRHGNAALTRVRIRTPDGRMRVYYLQVPAKPASRMPLVIVLHGADDTAINTIRQTDFARIGRQQRMLVAFAQGYKDTWNEGAGHTPAEVARIDDVAFIRAVIGQIEHRYPVDRSRVAAAGFSNGALMVQLLGCRLAGQIKLIAPVSGELPASVSPACHPSQPIGVLEVHGTADPVIPFRGGPFVGVGGGTTVLSAPASVRRWATLDACAHAPAVSHDGVRTVTRYPGCRSGVPVGLTAIIGGGHGWPDDIGALVAQALR